MPRRGAAARIYAAQRAGIFNRLRDAERMDELDAEHWIARWERHVAEAELVLDGGVFWDEAWRWIEAQRHPTKTDMGAEGDDGQAFGG